MEWALAIALVAACAAGGPAYAAEPARWSSVYDWPAGDGYAGWSQAATGGAGPYAFSQGSGLWVWPSGGDYRPGGATWRYRAPGTTRIVRARLWLRYPSRVASAHCVRVALDAGGAARDAAERCRPHEPAGGVTSWTPQLDDAAAAATTLDVGLELPCDKPNPKACARHIPSATAAKNGLRIVRAELLLSDDDAPAATAAGPFRELAGQYIDGRRVYALTMSGSDAGSGVARLALERNGSDLLAAPAPCDERHHTPALGALLCPSAFTGTVAVDTNVVPEGRGTYAVRATDVAGNPGRSAAWDVIVDRGAPAPAGEFEAGLDLDEGVTYLDWIPGRDPDLPDGTPGSGVGRERYRFKPVGGAWSGWQDVAGGQAEAPPFRLGEEIVVEAFAFDRVGNRSATARERVTVAPASSFNDDYEAIYEDTDPIAGIRFTPLVAVPGDPRALATDPRRKCAMSGIPPELTDKGDEQDVNVYTFGNFGCPVGDWRLQYIQVTACLEVHGNDGDWYPVGDCATDRREAPQPPVYAIVNELCRPGTHDYRVKLHGKVALRIVRDIHIRRTLTSDEKNCNEAGAWRSRATFGISDPSGRLGAELRRKKDFPPASSGFQAHHIVPASYASRASRAQRLAYACGFDPNGERNGVWLRGRPLRARGEAGATRSTQAYRELSEDGKRRAYHPTIHTRRHFRWIADLLDEVVYGNEQCRQPAGNAVLRSVKVALEHNAAKFRPEDDDPVSPQD